MRRAKPWLMSCGLALFAVGCHTCNRQPPCPPAPIAPIGQVRPVVPGPGGVVPGGIPPGGIPPGGIQPGGNQPGGIPPGGIPPGGIPPGGIPPGGVAPAGVAPGAGSPGPGPANPFPTSPGANRFPIVPPAGGANGPEAKGLGADEKSDSRWFPPDKRVELSPPEKSSGPDPGSKSEFGNKSEPGVKLYPPEKENSDSKEPPLIDKKSELAPRVAPALEKVDVGQKSALDGGADWLASKRYRAVLHVHAPGEDNSADKKLIEDAGIKYMELEVSPSTLTRDTVDEFSRLVSDKENRPLFVYDRDGSLVGGLWYLYFRMVEQHSDDVARVRSGPLGLKLDPDAPPSDMWQAIEKIVNEQGR